MARPKGVPPWPNGEARPVRHGSECCAGPIRANGVSEYIPHSTRERVEGFRRTVSGRTEPTAIEWVEGFQRLLTTAVLSTDEFYLADSRLEALGQLDRQHPVKALGPLRSRASLRSSSLTAFARAVLTSAGFPERPSPFRSARKAPPRTAPPQRATHLPNRFARSCVARSSLARRRLGMNRSRVAALPVRVEARSASPPSTARATAIVHVCRSLSRAFVYRLAKRAPGRVYDPRWSTVTADTSE